MMMLYATPNILVTNLDDEMMIDAASQGCTYFLNETAQAVFNVIVSNNGISRDDLIRQLASMYSIDYRTISHDVNTCVDLLLQYEVIYESA